MYHSLIYHFLLQAHIPLHYAEPYFGGVMSSAYGPQAMVRILLCLLGSFAALVLFDGRHFTLAYYQFIEKGMIAF